MKGRIFHIESNALEASSRPILCLLPGGPGLSASTLRSLDILSRSFHLAYVDPPGTGGTEELPDPSFENIIGAISLALEKLKVPLILCGHSFGAVYAMELSKSKNLNVKGLVLLAPAFLPKTSEPAGVASRVQKMQTKELEGAERQWEIEKTHEAFCNWLAAYGSLFYLERNRKEAQELIRKDNASVRTFLQIAGKWKVSSPDIKHLQELRVPKVVIAGQEDGLYLASLIREDAQEIGANFHLVSDAAHFVHFDQPQTVAMLIEKYFGNGGKKQI